MAQFYLTGYKMNFKPIILFTCLLHVHVVLAGSAARVSGQREARGHG